MAGAARDAHRFCGGVHAADVDDEERERSQAENLLLLLLFVLVFSSRPFLLFVLSAPKNVPVAFLDIDLNVVFVNFKFLAFCSKSTSKSHELAVDLGLFLSSFADIFFFDLLHF